MDSLRAFIAIELNDQIRNELTRIQDALKKSEADVKWVRPENLHLTLKFLGQITNTKVEKIGQVMQNSSAPFKPSSLKLGALGAFPKITYPRVIWVSLSSQEEQLMKLAQDLETGLVSLKFPKEKRDFKSHITLGRIRSSKNRNKLTELLTQVKVEQKQMFLESVSLFKSTLSCVGPHYECLINIKLK